MLRHGATQTRMLARTRRLTKKASDYYNSLKEKKYKSRTTKTKFQKSASNLLNRNNRLLVLKNNTTLAFNSGNNSIKSWLTKKRRGINSIPEDPYFLTKKQTRGLNTLQKLKEFARSGDEPKFEDITNLFNNSTNTFESISTTYSTADNFGNSKRTATKKANISNADVAYKKVDIGMNRVITRSRTKIESDCHIVNKEICEITSDNDHVTPFCDEKQSSYDEKQSSYDDTTADDDISIIDHDVESFSDSGEDVFMHKSDDPKLIKDMDSYMVNSSTISGKPINICDLIRICEQTTNIYNVSGWDNDLQPILCCKRAFLIHKTNGHLFSDDDIGLDCNRFIFNASQIESDLTKQNQQLLVITVPININVPHEWTSKKIGKSKKPWLTSNIRGCSFEDGWFIITKSQSMNNKCCTNNEHCNVITSAQWIPYNKYNRPQIYSNHIVNTYDAGKLTTCNKVTANFTFGQLLQNFPRNDRRVVILDVPNIGNTTSTVKTAIPSLQKKDLIIIERLCDIEPSDMVKSNATVLLGSTVFSYFRDMWHSVQSLTYKQLRYNLTSENLSDKKCSQIVRDICLQTDNIDTFDLGLDYCCTFNGNSTNCQPKLDIELIFALQRFPKHNGVLWLTCSNDRRRSDTASNARLFVKNTGLKYGYKIDLVHYFAYTGMVAMFFLSQNVK